MSVTKFRIWMPFVAIPLGAILSQLIWHCKPSCTAILTPTFPVGKVKFPVIFLNICSSRIQAPASVPAHSRGSQGSSWRWGRGTILSPVLFLAVLSHREILGTVFSSFLAGAMGTGLCTHLRAALGAGLGKTTNQQQSAPEKLPAKISQAQTQCSGQSETKVVLSGHFTLFL